MGSDGEETPVVNHNSSTHSSENGVIGLSKVMDRMEDLSNCLFIMVLSQVLGLFSMLAKFPGLSLVNPATNSDLLSGHLK